MSNDNDDITQAWDELLAGLDWIADAESADEMRTRAAALHTMARDLRKATEEREAELVEACDAAGSKLAALIAVDGDLTESQSELIAKAGDILRAAAKGGRRHG